MITLYQIVLSSINTPLVWIVSIILITIIFLVVVRYIYRKFKLLNLFLQKMVEIRTQELENQRAEMESQRDELHRINISKDRLFSIISHDLRNPLHGLVGLSGLMVNGYYDYTEEERKMFIEGIHESSNQMQQLIENLLHWSRAQTKGIQFSPKSFDIYALISECMDLMKFAAKKKAIELKFNTIEPLMVEADKDMLYAVLRNLLTNAIKFTAKGSVEAGAINEGDKIKIFVSDTGIGMTEQEIEKLTSEESFTTQGTVGEKGTGLGFDICKQFLKAHQSKFRIESELKIGTTIYFYLPTPKV